MALEEGLSSGESDKTLRIFGRKLNRDTLKRMVKYILSKSAQSDIVGIADSTLENFGIKQARKYRDGLISCFQDLTDRPERGRLYLHKDDTLLM